MKLHGHSNKLETNLVDNETQNFAIGDPKVVIGVLRKYMYKNKIRTLVQEYISNARDAMREVGKGNQIEVTAPTYLNPTFKVRDFGPGITVERMKKVFILYGASTKRGTNTQTGGFGIGAKSAWSYTDSFTIITVVDGVKRSYVAHTGVSDEGRLDLISTENTKEENGTEIQVAVKGGDVDEFVEAIQRAVFFWDERPTLKNCHVPDMVKGYKIGNSVEVVKSDDFPHFTSESDNNPTIVIDGIIYPVPDDLLDKCKTLKALHEFTRDKLVFRVDNGVLEVIASRESIADSPQSIGNIEKMAKKAAMEVKSHVAKVFGDVRGAKEYILTYRKLNTIFNVEAGFAKYGDYQIKNDAIYGDVLKKVRMTDINCLGKYGRGKVNKITKKDIVNDDRKCFSLALFDHVFFFHGQESDLVKNKRIRKYFETEEHTRILVVEPQPTWTTDEKTKVTTTSDGMAEFNKVLKDFELPDFRSLELPVVTKESRVKISREKTEFCLHVLDGREYGKNRFHYTTLETNKTQWLYVPMGEKGWAPYDAEQLRELNRYLREVSKDDVQICGLAERGLQMVQGNALFSPLKAWLDSYKPSKSEVNWVKMKKAANKESIEILREVKDIDDPELVAIVKEYKHGEAISGSIAHLPSILFQKIVEETELKEFLSRDEEIKKLVKKRYSLILTITDNAYYRRKDYQELAFYLNAKFNDSTP